MEDQYLASQFYSWLQDEMQYKPQGRFSSAGQPSVEQLAKICRGKSIAYLEYLMKHIFSQGFVSRTKKNLQISSKIVQGSYGTNVPSSSKNLREHKKELCERKQVLSNSIGMIQQDLEMLRSNALENERIPSAVLEKRHCAALLQSFYDQTSRTISVFDEHTSQLQENTLDILQIAQDIENLQEMKYQLPGQPESTCQRDIQEAISILKAFLQKLLQGQFANDVEELKQEKSSIVSYMEGLAEKHSPQKCILALCQSAQQHIFILQDKLTVCNVQKEAKQLRLKFEAGEVTDPSHPFYQTKIKLHPLSQLMHAQHAEVVQIFLFTKEAQNSVTIENSRRHELKQQLQKKLEVYFSAATGDKELAYLLVNAEISMVEFASIVRTLEIELENVREELLLHRDRFKQLSIRHQQIKEFSHLVEGREQVIQTLLKQNIGAKEKLRKLRLQIQNYTEEMLSTKPEEIRRETTLLGNMASREIELFFGSNLPQLQLVHLDSVRKVCLVDLSINKLTLLPRKSSNLQTITQLATIFCQHLHKDVSCLLERIASFQTGIGFHRVEPKQTFPFDNETNVQFLDRMNRLIQLMPKADKEQETTIVPLLEEGLTRVMITQSEVTALRQTVAHWWEQPSATCTPWITLDDKNFQKWHKQWSILTTQLRSF